MKLTKQQAVEEHRKMWNWIADETLKRKRKVTKNNYFDEVYSDDLPFPHDLCFCCEYVKQLRMEDPVINRMECHLLCPIKWPGGGCYINTTKHLCFDFFRKPIYKKWKETTNYEKAAKYARMIAELPEKGILMLINDSNNKEDLK